MKKLNMLRLNHISKAEMEKRQMNAIKGGSCGCIYSCPCRYEGPQCTTRDDDWGGSSTDQNDSANSNTNGVWAG